MAAASNSEGQNEGTNFLRKKFKYALNSSTDILCGITNNISSRLSIFSNASSSSVNIDTSQHASESDAEDPPLALHKLPGTPEPLTSPQSSKRSPITMREKLKETFKLENLKELRPAFEDLMLSDESTEPSTLPTNTPESPKSGFRFKLSTINQSLPKKLGDYKALAIRTLSGEADTSGDKPDTACAIDGGNDDDNKKSNNDNGTISHSSKSFTSLESLHATGSDSCDKHKFKQDMHSSGNSSEVGVGNSVSLDSSDSDPHKKLWIRSGSQTSLQSWASSLSYDSQTEDINDIRQFMRSFVDDVFKHSANVTVDRKAEFGQYAQMEQGRLWFARCINAKRGCRCVSEVTFFSLIQHFAVMLFECCEADDFSPAKSLMNMCFTYFHEITSPGGKTAKEFVYMYLRQQSIWKSSRFWNAAFFDALQCERFLRPVAMIMEISGSRNRHQAINDERHYQENITFGQLGTFTCNMHAFGLSKEMVTEFLRKQVVIASLRDEQVKLLRDNLERMYSNKKEWN